MPHNQIRFYVLALILVILNVVGLFWVRNYLSIASTPKARVLWALPEVDVDNTDRFTLVFDRPLVAPMQVGESLARSPFRIEPRPVGSWRWAGVDRLEYVLQKPLPPGNIFTICPASDLKAQLGCVLAGKTEFVFRTRALSVGDVRSGLCRRDQAFIKVDFNQPVDPASLLTFLTISDGVTEEEIRPHLVTRDPGSTIEFWIDPPECAFVLVEFEKGLTGQQGEIGLKDSVSRVVHLNPAFALTYTDTYKPSLHEEAVVYLHFSHSLDRTQSLPEVVLQPAVEDIRTHLSHSALRLTGSFVPCVQYKATVHSTILSESGDPLGEDQEVVFEIPEYEPDVSFPVGRGVLTPQGNLTLELRAVNISGVELSASKVHANNLVAHLRGEYEDATSRVLFGNREIPLEMERNRPVTLAVDLETLLEKPRGVYRIEADASDRYWTDSDAVVTVTDLALTVKMQREGLLVWVTSLRTGNPVSGAALSALSYANQILATAVSSREGLALLEIPNTHPDGPPWVITASKKDDLSYLKLDQGKWLFEGAESVGRQYPDSYDIMLYSERGVYRPGDTIFYTGILRERDGSTPNPFPLTINVVRPDGRCVSSTTVTPQKNWHGMFHGSHTTWEADQTGAYRICATLPGSQERLGEAEVLVEAFVPVRMEVSASPKKDLFFPHEKPAVRVSARYLFDQPAADLPVSVQGSFRRAAFHSKKYPDFTFDTPDKNRRVKIPSGKGQLDQEGRATLAIDASALDKPGLWSGEFSVTVTEPGGRSVSCRTNLLVDTADRHVGLHLREGTLVPTGAPLSLEWIVRSGEDEPGPPSPMTIALARVEWDTILQEVNGRCTWKSVERTVPLWEKRLEGVKPSGVMEILCPQAGHYRAISLDSVTGSETHLDFHAAEKGKSEHNLAMNRPERLELVLDKESYMPGDTAGVLVRSPFLGTMLLTVETDRVLHHRVLQLDGNSVYLKVPVDPTLRGGAFVIATLVRALDPTEQNWLPHRAIGLAQLKTSHDDHRLGVAIQAPRRSKPGETIQVTIQTSPDRNGSGNPAGSAGGGESGPGVLHFWAVDEGILLTTGYGTPDPAGHFFAKRGLEVESMDLFSRLFPDYQRPVTMARIGADEGEASIDSCRRSPVAFPRREPAVVWRKSVLLESDGSITVELNLPDHKGELRLMAVAALGDQYGTAEAALTITQPLLVEASWPRFVAPEDHFRVPVKLFSSAEGPLSVELEVHAKGPVHVDPPDTKALPVILTPGRPATVWLDCRATETGQTHVEVKATSGPLTSVSRAAFPVRPPSHFFRESNVIALQAGSVLEMKRPEKFIKGTGKLTLSIGGSPDVQLRPSIEKLIDYPHGCVEQTTSRLAVLLCAPQVLKGTGEAARIATIREMISTGIARLQSMQTRSGGLAYWPGERKPCLWGTAYAAEVLLNARNAGYPVREDFIKDILDYLEKELYGGNQIYSDRSSLVNDNMRSLLCSILAEFNRPAKGWMARLGNRLDRLDIAGRAHLASAWFFLGRKDHALAALEKDTPSIVVPATYAGRITSQVRQDAVLLKALLMIDASHSWIPLLVQRIEAARSMGAWGNTLENATALSALAAYMARGADPSKFSGTLKARHSGEVTFDHSTPVTCSYEDIQTPLSLSTQGRGEVYVSLTWEGQVNPEEVKTTDRGLKVRRIWKDVQGKPVDGRNLRIGDLILVSTTLEVVAERGEEVENIAVVDTLPGGFEVENPRLITSSLWSEEGLDKPDRVEFLDDRVVLFSSAKREPKTFKYALRVITEGDFALPPVEASSMYNANLSSRSGGGAVEVRR